MHRCFLDSLVFFASATPLVEEGIAVKTANARMTRDEKLAFFSLVVVGIISLFFVWFFGLILLIGSYYYKKRVISEHKRIILENGNADGETVVLEDVGILEKKIGLLLGVVIFAFPLPIDPARIIHEAA